MTTTIFNDREIRSGIGGNRQLLFRAALLALAFAIVILVISNLMRVTRIGAGYVGVEVNLAGSQRGAQDIPVRTGWVFYSPLKTEVIPFPTFVQTVKWTADVGEGHPYNEENVFNSKEGQEVRADVSMSYAIDSVKVPEFYVKYRTDNLDRFTHGILKDIVRNSLNEMASTYKLEDIYGENKAQFLRESRERVQAQVSPVGVQIQQFGFIGTEAERARNQRAVTQAEMAKAVAEAEGEARSQIARAHGEATSLIERARGEAEANRLRQASITPQLLAWRRLENQRALVERWNGDLPKTVLGEKSNLLLPFQTEQK